MGSPETYLRAVRIEGFRSCQRTSFQLNRHLSVLIGPNGAGKTNILQAITLLGSWAGRPRMFRKSETAVSQCRILAEFQVRRRNLALRSTLSYALDEENKEDVVGSREQWRFGRIEGPKGSSKDWKLFPPELLYHTQRPYKLGVAGRTFVRQDRRRLEQLQLPLFLPDEIPPAPVRAAVAHALRFRNRISYYGASQFTNPARCPSSIEIDEEGDFVRPGPSRREHQRFLFDLYRLRETSPDKYSSYISLVGKQGLRLISNIHWKQVKVASSQIEVRTGGRVVKRNRRRLLIVPTIQSGADRLSFSQLSEGTFRTLAMVFYLITDDSDLLLLEEPEVCVHHGLLASIVELIKSQSSEKQIIFSTHSDFVLDQLTPDQVFSVTRPERKGTIVRSLASGYPRKAVQALRDFLRTSGNLGEFWRQGGFDH